MRHELEPAAERRENGEHADRDEHRPRPLAEAPVLVEVLLHERARLAREDEEPEAERVEAGERARRRCRTAQKTQPYHSPCWPSAPAEAMIGSFEKKPLNGGTPTSASEPARKHHFVNGMSLPSPRMLRMSCSPASAWIDEARPSGRARLEEGVRDAGGTSPFAYAPTPTPMNM